MRFFSSVLLVLALFSGSNAVAAKELVRLKDSNDFRIQKLIDQSVELLPVTFFSKIKKTIVVKVSPRGDYLARASGHTVWLGRQFQRLINLPPNEIIQNSSQFRSIFFAGKDFSSKELAQLILPSHETVNDFLIATLIHEYAHVYDSNAPLHGSNASSTKACFAMDEEKWMPGDPCHLSYANRRYALSDSYEFLNLAHWNNSMNLSKRKSYQALEIRSPDTYESKNPQEAFAVNFEYFVLDPSFKCRRSTMYEFLSRELSWHPYVGQECDMKASVVVGDLSSPKEMLLDLDSTRLYSVEYLLAAPGSGMASRWGHAMVRFVFCPEGQPMSEKCRERAANSVVLTFRGFIDDFVQSTWKGLTGEYKSSAYFRRLPSVQTDYNTLEFRDIVSYPLQVTEAEKKRLLKLAIEYHWTYQSKYYFVTNNCAVETLNYLKSALFDHPSFQAEITNTPVGVAIALEKNGLINRSRPTKPYTDLFPSKEPIYEKALNIVAEFSGRKLESLKSYRELSRQDRATLILDVENADNSQVTTAVYLLHDRLFHEKQKIVLAEIIKSQEHQTIQEAADQYISMMQLISAPGLLIPTRGYGSPLSEERRELNNSLDARSAKGLEEALQKHQADVFKSAANPVFADFVATAEELVKLKTLIAKSVSQLPGISSQQGR